MAPPRPMNEVGSVRPGSDLAGWSVGAATVRLGIHADRVCPGLAHEKGSVSFWPARIFQSMKESRMVDANVNVFACCCPSAWRYRQGGAGPI